MSTGPGIPRTDALSFGCANMEHGGLDRDGSDARWQRTIMALIALRLDVVALQELSALRDPYRLNAHAWRTANALGMFPVLGPPGGISGNHTAILVNPARLTIADSGPPPRPHGDNPAWCEALLSVHPSGPVIRVYSAHLPARTAAQQLQHAQALANTIAQRGEHAIALGDWNCYARGDGYTGTDLARMPLHLRPVRMRAARDELVGNYDVDDTLTSVGMVDVAAMLPPECRTPPQLVPTGINSGGRPDRAYATPEMCNAGAIDSYAVHDGGGSDHRMFKVTVRMGLLSAAVAPGFRP